jgi:hypothetical protein
MLSRLNCSEKLLDVHIEAQAGSSRRRARLSNVSVVQAMLEKLCG